MPRWSKLVAIVAVVGSVVYVGTQIHRHHRRWEHIHHQVEALMEQRYQTECNTGNAAANPMPCTEPFFHEEDEHRDGDWFGHHRHRHHHDEEVSPRSPSHSDPRRDPRGFDIQEPRIVVDPPEVFYPEAKSPGLHKVVDPQQSGDQEQPPIISDPAEVFIQDLKIRFPEINIRFPDDTVDIRFPPDIAMPDDRIRFPTDVRFPDDIEQHVDVFNPEDLHQVPPAVVYPMPAAETPLAPAEITPAETDQGAQWRRIHQEIRRLKRDGCKQTGAFVAGAAFAGGVAHLVALKRERRRREEEERAQAQAQQAASQPRGTADI